MNSWIALIPVSSTFSHRPGRSLCQETCFAQVNKTAEVQRKMGRAFAALALAAGKFVGRACDH